MGAMTEELERIVAAIRAGDAEGAQRAAAEHVRRAAALAEERLAEAAAV
jgi:DNA-binding GntR family transcriptional regulator